jgi:hypothetical protein
MVLIFVCAFLLEGLLYFSMSMDDHWWGGFPLLLSVGSGIVLLTVAAIFTLWDKVLG